MTQYQTDIQNNNGNSTIEVLYGAKNAFKTQNAQNLQMTAKFSNYLNSLEAKAKNIQDNYKSEKINNAVKSNTSSINKKALGTTKTSSAKKNINADTGIAKNKSNMNNFGLKNKPSGTQGSVSQKAKTLQNQPKKATTGNKFTNIVDNSTVKPSPVFLEKSQPTKSSENLSKQLFSKSKENGLNGQLNIQNNIGENEGQNIIAPMFQDNNPAIGPSLNPNRQDTLQDTFLVAENKELAKAVEEIKCALEGIVNFLDKSSKAGSSAYVDEFSEHSKLSKLEEGKNLQDLDSENSAKVSQGTINEVSFDNDKANTENPIKDIKKEIIDGIEKNIDTIINAINNENTVDADTKKAAQDALETLEILKEAFNQNPPSLSITDFSANLQEKSIQILNDNSFETSNVQEIPIKVDIENLSSDTNKESTLKSNLRGNNGLESTFESNFESSSKNNIENNNYINSSKDKAQKENSPININNIKESKENTDTETLLETTSSEKSDNELQLNEETQAQDNTVISDEKGQNKNANFQNKVKSEENSNQDVKLQNLKSQNAIEEGQQKNKQDINTVSEQSKNKEDLDKTALKSSQNEISAPLNGNENKAQAETLKAQPLNASDNLNTAQKLNKPIKEDEKNGENGETEEIDNIFQNEKYSQKTSSNSPVSSKSETLENALKQKTDTDTTASKDTQKTIAALQSENGSENESENQNENEQNQVTDEISKASKDLKAQINSVLKALNNFEEQISDNQKILSSTLLKETTLENTNIKQTKTDFSDIKNQHAQTQNIINIAKDLSIKDVSIENIEKDIILNQSSNLDNSGALSVVDEVIKLSLDKSGSENSVFSQNLAQTSDFEGSGSEGFLNNIKTLQKAGQGSFENPKFEGAKLNEAKILEQITNKIEQLKNQYNQQTGSRLTMVLRPNDLGRLSIQLTSNHLGLTTNIVAQNDDVRQYIEKNINNLREQLANSGVNVNSIQIKTQGQEGSSSYTNQHFKQESSEQNNLAQENSSENKNQNENAQNQSFQHGQNSKQSNEERAAILNELNTNFDHRFRQDFSAILNKSMNYNLV